MIRIGSCPECHKEIAVGSAAALAEDALVQCPICEAKFARRRLVLHDVPALILPENAAPWAPSETVVASEKIPDALGHDTFTAPAAEAARGPAKEDTSPIDLPVVTPSRKPQDYDAPISAAPRTIQYESSRSVVRQFLNIVGGGAVGLALGYFILLWIGGPQKDFLEIGRQLPPWAVPAEFHPIGEAPAADQNVDERSLGDLLDASEDTSPGPRDKLEGLPPEPPAGSTNGGVKE
jgi:hypothetical protein